MFTDYICLYDGCILMCTDVYCKYTHTRKIHYTETSVLYAMIICTDWCVLRCTTRKKLHYTEECVTKHGTTRKACISSKHGIARKTFAIQNSKHGRHGKQHMTTTHGNARKKMKQLKQNMQRHGTNIIQRKHSITRNKWAPNKTQHGLERNTIM